MILPKPLCTLSFIFQFCLAHDQAAARVRRDGQKKRVYIYRFLSAGKRSTSVRCRKIKEGLQKVIQQEQTDNLETLGNFSTEVLRDLFSFHESVKSEIHERMHCTRCQKSDDGPQSDEGKYIAHSTTSYGEFDEETSDDVGTPLEEDLGSWGHHFFPTTVPDSILQASAGDGVIFVFTNQVDGKLTPIDSTVSSKQQQEESKELIHLKRNVKQNPLLSLPQKPSYSLKPSVRPAALSSARMKENTSIQAALHSKKSLVNQLPQ